MRIVAALFLATVLAACGSTGGKTGPAVKPAELADFQARVALERAWRYDVGASGAYSFSPDTDGAAAYVAGAEGHVAKLDLGSGQAVWRVETGLSLSAGVGVGEGLALVGTPKGELLALRTDNGQVAWRAALTGEVLTAPVAGAGLVAARTNDGKVWLLSAADGKTRWVYSRALPALILREPGDLLLTDEAVYAGYPGGKLVALSLAKGAPLWEANVALPKGATELERIADVAGALAVDGRVVCASAYQGRIGCFERANGNALWARDFSGLTGPAMGEHYLFAADEEGVTQALDTQRGASLWRQEALRGRGLTTPLALAAGYVAVADFQGVLHLLGAEDGALAGRAATDDSAVRGRMLPLKSGVIVQTSAGGVHAFKIQ